MRRILTLFVLALSTTQPLQSAEPPPEQALTKMHPQLTTNIARTLRYFPVNGDYVITNGAELFNRPLYCVNSAFRIDGGDKPEFSIYLPGRGGNLRLGIKAASSAKWLNNADEIVTRYRGGELIYEIHDSLLGEGELDLTVLPLSEAKGVIARAELRNARSPIEFIFAFGGANGSRGKRGGDIGCENQPVSKFFQLRPDECLSNEFEIVSNTFILHSKPATIAGTFPAGSKLQIVDATRWDVPNNLTAETNLRTRLSILAGQIDITTNQTVCFSLQQISTGEDSDTISATDLPQLLSAAENHRRRIAGRVTVETPDEFINAAVPALNIAADAIWDAQQQAFMHGAVAWRQRLLGWRGPYAGDALGWHNRTAKHFIGFALEQNISPIPEKIPPADENPNLARSENALHSNGNMTKAHYDMNLVAVDAFFRHLLWTGDLQFARTNWPVIERHFAWERRLFRREFGDDHLPLYEAYAAIWASDDLNYNGGGTAHASAYNYFANKMAAQVAAEIGKDPSPYEREANLILMGMNKYLWLTNDGNFAEFKDYLGLQLTHPNSGLWTFYNTIDSEVPTSAQASQMCDWIDQHIAHFSLQVSNGEPALTNLFILPETSWMPYQWSLNNVVMAENAHTALGFWQANRPDTAFDLFKGELLESGFLGLCPGNYGAMTSHDAARGEAQRDFGDAIGINSRTLVEGLFGVKPDALAGELRIVPGFPSDWTFAKMHHPDFDFEFQRTGVTETYTIESKFPVPMKLILEAPALNDSVDFVSVNGKPTRYELLQGVPDSHRIKVEAAAASQWHVQISWKGNHLKVPTPGNLKEREIKPIVPTFDWNEKIRPDAQFQVVDLTKFFNDRVTQIFRNEYRSPRSPFCSLATPKQGIGGWCEPDAMFNVDDSGLRKASMENGGKINLPDGIPFATPTNDANNIVFTSQWDNYPKEVSLPLEGTSSHAFLLMAGSTAAMESRFDNGEVIVTYTDGSTAKLTLRNPETWWPIDQDYFTDDFAFRLDAPLPPRVDLQTGKVRILNPATFKGKGGRIPGGAATVLDLPLDRSKTLKSLTIRSIANEVVIGLMAATLER